MKQSKIIILTPIILGLVLGLITFTVGSKTQSAETVESIKAKAQKEYSGIISQLAKEKISIQSSAGLAGNLAITPALPDIKTLFLTQIAQSETILQAWNDAVQRATTLAEAQAQYLAKNQDKIEETILPALKTAKTINEFYAKIIALNLYRNNLTKINANFSSSYCSFVQNDANITKIKGARDIFLKLTNWLNQATNNKSLFNQSTYQNLFNNPNAGNQAKINKLNQDIKSVSAFFKNDAVPISLNGVNSAYQKGLKTIKEVYVSAAKTKCVQPKSTNFSAEMKAEYQKEYDYWTAMAGNLCYSANDAIYKNINKLAEYQAKINNFVFLATTTKTALEQARTTADTTLKLKRNGLGCPDSSYNQVNDFKTQADGAWNNFLKVYSQAEQLNANIKIIDEAENFISARSGGPLTQLTAAVNNNQTKFTGEEKTALAEITTLATAINTQITSLKTKCDGMEANIATLNDTLMKLLLTENKTLKGDIKNFKNRWYALIKAAAENGSLKDAGADFTADLQAYRAIESFNQKRIYYYAQAEKIIETRITAINNYQEKITRATPTAAEDANLTQIVTNFTTAAETKTTALTDKNSEIKNTIDYSELKALVASIKDLHITDIFLPAQKAAIQFFSYYDQYQEIQTVADSIETVSQEALDRNNPSLDNINKQIASLENNLSALKRTLGSISTQLTTIAAELSNLAEKQTIKNFNDTMKPIPTELTKLKQQAKNLYKDFVRALQYQSTAETE